MDTLLKITLWHIRIFRVSTREMSNSFKLWGPLQTYFQPEICKTSLKGRLSVQWKHLVGRASSNHTGVGQSKEDYCVSEGFCVIGQDAWGRWSAGFGRGGGAAGGGAF